MILRITVILTATAAAALLIWTVSAHMQKTIERTMELHRNFSAPSFPQPTHYDI